MTDLKSKIKNIAKKDEEKKTDKSKNPIVEFNPPEKTEHDIDEAVAVKGASSQQYAIKSGDTLSQIAKTSGISVKDIMRKNPDITDPNTISAGKQISLPKAAINSDNPLTKTSPKIYDSGFGTDKGPTGGYAAAVAQDKTDRDAAFQTKNSTPVDSDATKPTATADSTPMINVTPKPIVPAITTPSVTSASTPKSTATTSANNAPAPASANTASYTDELNKSFGGNTATANTAPAANTVPAANTTPKKTKLASNDDDDDMDESVSDKLINSVLQLETNLNSNKFQIVKTINEVSAKTLHSYIGKAMTDNSVKRKTMDDVDTEISKMPPTATKFDKKDLNQKYIQNRNKSMKRMDGIDTALSKLKTKVVNNTEQIFSDKELTHIEAILNKE